MRNATACKQCRQSKRRCARPAVDGVPCNNCHRRFQHCSFAPLPHDRPRHLNVSIAPEVQSPDSRPEDLLARLSNTQKLALVDNYFALIHDRPHSLFHRPTFMAELQSNRIRTSLILSVCALASYLSTDDSIRSLGQEMALASKNLLLADIGSPAIAHIQTAILLATIYAAERQPRADAMFIAIAARMAQILRLHDVHEGDDAVTAETKARVWWTLIMFDYWGSAGLMIRRKLEHQPSNIPYPGPEDIFQAAKPFQQTLEVPESGLWAHMINLVKIFGFIQDLHQELATQRLSHADVDSKVEDLATRLDAWASALPKGVVLSDANIRHHIARGLGGAFMALHLGFHHYFTLLFYHSLDSYQPPTTNKSTFTQRCRGHAMKYSELLQTSRNTPGCEASYPVMGHMAVVSSSVLLHMLLFGDDIDLVKARDSLMGNFEALMELEKFWPSLGVSMRRLHTFQDVCRQPANLSTYRIDQWMFRFLYEHSNSLGDRVAPKEEGDSSSVSPAASSLGSSNAEAPPLPPRFQEVAKGREAVLSSALDFLRR